MKTSRLDRILLVASASCFLLCLVWPTLLRTAHPKLAATDHYYYGSDGKDPWGHPYSIAGHALPSARHSFVLPHSLGPDGIDQQGKGDDLQVGNHTLSVLLTSRIGDLLAFLALFSLWGALRPGLRGPNSYSPGTEALRVAGFALPLGVVLTLAFWSITRVGRAAFTETGLGPAPTHMLPGSAPFAIGSLLVGFGVAAALGLAGRQWSLKAQAAAEEADSGESDEGATADRSPGE